MKINIKKFIYLFYILFAIVIIYAFFILLSKFDNNSLRFILKNTDIVNTSSLSIKNFEEMRGVWVPYMSIDVSKNFSEENFKNKFRNIVDVAKNHKLNTLIVHIHPFGDALYKSNYFPWSHILTGQQGKEPQFDPLEFMVSCTHEHNMKFHAWINPFRIKFNNSPKELADTNPYSVYSKIEEQDYFIKVKDDIYFNPSNEKSRQLIISDIKNIVKNYKIDGIHFDDYFYPIDDEYIDKNSYDIYKNKFSTNGKPLSLMEWRKENINLFISGVYSAIKSINHNVEFGISPCGNIDITKKMCADVESWCTQKGYIDYITPQIYWNSDNPIVSFEESVNLWHNLANKDFIKLYLGLALYKAGSDVDDNTWKKADNIISRQILLARSLNYDGFMLYSWDFLVNSQTKNEVAHILEVTN